MRRWGRSRQGEQARDFHATAKQECGLDDYRVRRYPGWHPHITLATAAHACLTLPELRRLITRLTHRRPPPNAHVLHWSHWRRRRQHQARVSHYKQRGHTPSGTAPPSDQRPLQYQGLSGGSVTNCRCTSAGLAGPISGCLPFSFSCTSTPAPGERLPNRCTSTVATPAQVGVFRVRREFARSPGKRWRRRPVRICRMGEYTPGAASSARRRANRS